MTKYCRAVLEDLRTLSGDAENVIIASNREHCFFLKYSPESHVPFREMYTSQVSGVLEILAKRGYVHQINDYEFWLAHKGLHPTAVILEELFLFLMRSIVTPIIVSVLTTLITLSIQGRL